jgi:hypothetical protein
LGGIESFGQDERADEMRHSRAFGKKENAFTSHADLQFQIPRRA